MPSEPKEIPCEWCRKPSAVAVEIKRRSRGNWVPTGQHIYACHEHEHLAEEMQFQGRR